MFYTWMREGEALERLHESAGKVPRSTAYQKACLKFVQDVRRAISDGQAALLALIHKGAREDWRAGAWILERRHPEDFSKRHYQAMQENKDESITVIFRRPAIDVNTASDDLVDGIDDDLTGE